MNADIFKHELDFISDGKVRGFVENTLKELPEYFEHVAASSSGKYHPKYALGEGGLVRHVKAAVGIAHAIFGADLPLYADLNQDVIYAALLLHDGLKHGPIDEGCSVFEHPLVMSNFILDKNEEDKALSEETSERIARCVASHMGKWTTSECSDKKLPAPYTKEEQFVHLCDYLASRKNLEYIF